MMRSVTAGLGALTILAVTGAMTTSGQTFLGFRSPAQNTSSVTASHCVRPHPARTGATREDH